MLYIIQSLKWIPLSLTTIMIFFLNTPLFAGVSDLAVVRIRTFPTNPIALQDEVLIKVYVKNFGHTRTPHKAKLTVELWSVNQKNLVIHGTAISNILSRSPHYNIPQLDPGQEIVFSAKHLFRYAGRHKIVTSINTELFSEGEEVLDNNRYSIYFNVRPARPDLVVCMKEHNKVRPHVKNAFPVKIRNIGLVDSDPCDLRFWIEKKGIKHYKIPRIGPGASYTVVREVYFARRKISKFSIEIDSRSEVPEMHEKNNILKGIICTEHYCPSPENSRIKCSNKTRSY